MFLSIGQVSKLLGVQVETLHYYEHEGLISPGRNPENNYRQFSTENLIVLLDVLYYRSVGISIEEIKRIMNGLRADEITTLIRGKKEEIENQIRKYQILLDKLNKWETLHEIYGINYLNKYDVRKMPTVLVPKERVNGLEDSMDKLISAVNDNNEMAYYLTFSFKYNDESRKYFQYVVLDKWPNTDKEFPFANERLEKEICERCIYSVVKYDADHSAMVSGIKNYALLHDIKLTGNYFGRSVIVEYQNSKYTEYYRIYAEIE